MRNYTNNQIFHLNTKRYRSGAFEKIYSPARKFSNFASSMSHGNNAKGFEFPRSVRRPYLAVSYNTYCPQKYDFTYEKWRREGYIEISAWKIAARYHYIFFITGKCRSVFYLYFPMSDFVDSQTHKAKIWSAPYLLYSILVFRFSRVWCRAVTYSYV